MNRLRALLVFAATLGGAAVATRVDVLISREATDRAAALVIFLARDLLLLQSPRSSAQLAVAA